MDPEIQKKIADISKALFSYADYLQIDARSFNQELLTHLSKINSTLSAIDRNLSLLEMKK